MWFINRASSKHIRKKVWNFKEKQMNTLLQLTSPGSCMRNGQIQQSENQ